MQPNDSQDPNRLIPSQVVRHKLGGISLSTLERWIRRPELNFPEARKIGDRRFWHEADVNAWINQGRAEA